MFFHQCWNNIFRKFESFYTYLDQCWANSIHTHYLWFNMLSILAYWHRNVGRHICLKTKVSEQKANYVENKIESNKYFISLLSKSFKSWFYFIPYYCQQKHNIFYFSWSNSCHYVEPPWIIVTSRGWSCRDFEPPIRLNIVG